MPLPADKPLRKVTLNLFEEDVANAEKYLGQGWSTTLRNVWAEWLSRRYHASITKTKHRTLGDLRE